jgi:soluble lytic murein transglycosylase-like protein
VKKLLIGLALVLTLGFVLAGHLAIDGYGKLQEQAAATERVKVEQAEKDQAYRDRLADWVYHNSSKIARSATRPIVDEAMQYEHPLLLLALIQAESEFSPTAYSSAQAVGMGQIRWSVWGKPLVNAGICKEARDLYDIATNIRAANYILMTEIKATNGNFVQALERYVGGKHKRYVDQIAYNYVHLGMIKA